MSEGDEIDLGREHPFVLGAAAVSPSSLEISSDRGVERVEPRPMQVLVALSRRKGEVVSRRDVLAICWGGRRVSEDAVQRAVSKARRIAETHAAGRIETIPRVGFRLIEATTVSPYEVSAAPVDVGVAINPRQTRLRAPVVLLALSIMVAILAIATVGRLLGGWLPLSAPPTTLVWQYGLGKRADAPNGLRFWSTQDGRIWTETFADGKVRNHLVYLSRIKSPQIQCTGSLLRRDSSLIALIPDSQCVQKNIMAQDVEPKTGLITRDWYVLGRILSR